jgi:predicted amidohydrolase
VIYKAACIQYNPQLNDFSGNLAELAGFIEEAAASGAALVVCPEMALTGYHYESREHIRPYTDTIPGRATSTIGEVCRRYGAFVVVGMAERDADTDLFYISAALIGPDGFIGRYRKMHLWETETKWATAGDLGFPVWETKIGRITINICMDAAYFESARIPALKGADVMAFPTNSSSQSVALLQGRAESNGLYVVSANRSGEECGFHMVGASAVWGPGGDKLAEAPVVLPGDNAPKGLIVYADIDTARYQNPGKRRQLERRPELYRELMLSVTPWSREGEKPSCEVGVASIQYEPERVNRTANYNKLETLLAQASVEGAYAASSVKLAVLPELSLLGPPERIGVEEAFRSAESLDGGTVELMKELASRYRTHLVFGMIERDGPRLYNTALLINPEGHMEGHYRKAHLSATERLWAGTGDSFPVFHSDELGAVGILIGEDAAFEETSGIMAVKRANLIAVPSAWRGQYGSWLNLAPNLSQHPYPPQAMTAWNALAMQSQAVTIVANYTGGETGCFGGSGIYGVDPLYGLDRTITSDASPCAVVGAIRPVPSDWWFHQQKLLLTRRPTRYQELVRRHTDQPSLF